MRRYWVLRNRFERRWKRSEPLTGLRNRRLLVRRIHRSIDRGRVGTQLVLFDVDGLIYVNDEFGFHVADCLLVHLAAELRRLVGRRRAYRPGSDEFAVLLDRDADAATLIGEFESSCAVAHRHVQGLGRPVTVSAGVASIALGIDTRTLLADAVAALLEAKRAKQSDS